jgi:hypothetical protein
MQFAGDESAAAKAKHFVRDLGHVLSLADELGKAIDAVVADLLHPQRGRWTARALGLSARNGRVLRPSR